jgi:hypothetical protein
MTFLQNNEAPTARMSSCGASKSCSGMQPCSTRRACRPSSARNPHLYIYIDRYRDVRTCERGTPVWFRSLGLRGAEGSRVGGLGDELCRLSDFKRGLQGWGFRVGG